MRKRADRDAAASRRSRRSAPDTPAGGGDVDSDGTFYAYEFGVGEKVLQSFELEVTSPGGHSSTPRRDNAIYHLAAGLVRLPAVDFPIRLDDTTRACFDRMSRLPATRDRAAGT